MPCTSSSLPALMKLYDEFADLRERFEILAFHDPSAKTFKKLDPKLLKFRKYLWNGKDLPFPILLDSTGKTVKTYGISCFPTLILIDPDGKVVRGGSERMLEQKLEAMRKQKPKVPRNRKL